MANTSTNRDPRARAYPSKAPPKKSPKKLKLLTPVPVKDWSNLVVKNEEIYHLSRHLKRDRTPPDQRQKWIRHLKQTYPEYRSKWTRKAIQYTKSTDSEDSDEFYTHNSWITPKYERDALLHTHQKSYDSNLLLEIRDVRLPASTHHPSFTRLARHRRHLICYTHGDLVDPATRDAVRDWTTRSWPLSDCRFMDTRVDFRRNDDLGKSMEGIYRWIVDNVQDAGGLNCALTVGVPNVGKSSILQVLLRYAKTQGLIPKITKTRQLSSGSIRERKKHLRKGVPPTIEDVPGKTRVMTEYLLQEKPKVLFLDVPGMSPPSFMFHEKPEVWYGMGATNLLHLPKTPDVRNYHAFCEYVLYCLNRDHNFTYVENLRLSEPTHDVYEAVQHLLKRVAERRPNSDSLHLKRCKLFLKFFNQGSFGSVILDDISKPFEPFVFKDEHFQRENTDEEEFDSDSDFFSD